MNNSFDSWDAGLHTEDCESLEHYGIPGMKWGVRRYQSKDGTLTPAGLKRYGTGATKRTSAKKMAKDFNKLDAGYANIASRARYNQKKVSKYAIKGHAAQRKGKEEKAKKLIGKSLKYANKAALNNQQKKSVESLQWKIIGKAATKGYTTRGKPVERTGKIGMRKGVNVDGMEVKITKRGLGGTKIVNYANANKIAAEERERQRARQMYGVRR